jgi:TolB-like protein/DNA-binding winged helix-turn-helix (wHTH) protein
MTSELSARRVAAFDGWTLLRAPLELTRNGERVRLQEQPLAILEMLLARPRELVTREELIARLWPKGVVDFEAGLNTAMRKLRATLGDEAEAPRYIETVPRQGYRFVAALDAAATIEPPAPDPEPASAAPAPPVIAPPQISRPHRRWPGFFASIALVLVATAAVIFAVRTWRDASPAEYKRVAVLPFENLSPDPANAYFADGVHDEILTALASGAPELEVISRTTMMSYRGQGKRVPELARELEATHVLAGTVRRESRQVRVTLQLIDARSDRELWTRSFDRELASVMQLQSDLAREVAAQLSVELHLDAARLPPPRVLEAYDLWLQGVLAWQNIGGGGATQQEIRRTEELYTRAIALDPTYAAAYADRARVLMARFIAGTDMSPENLQRVRDDIAAARRYGGRAPYVLVREAQLAFLVEGDLPRALALIDEAEKQSPLSADQLMTQANFLAQAGQKDRSLALHARAASLDPANPTLFRFWMNNLFAARLPAEAMRVAREFDKQIPARIDRGEPLFAFTGSTARWRQELARVAEAQAGVPLSAEFDLLRYEGKLSEIDALLANNTATSFRQHSANRNLIGAFDHPVAELRGWARLLAADAPGAQREGRVLATFLEGIEATPQTQWYHATLDAQAALFAGDHARARTAAKDIRKVGRPVVNAAFNAYTALMTARILAWAEDPEGALAVLEAASGGYPSVGPALITRDPLISRPLEHLARWKTLRDRLEAEIAANQSLL